MTVTYKTFCETGLKRKINQDRITAYSNKNISLFAVADGVGGHSMGEYASETTIKYLAIAAIVSLSPSMEIASFMISSKPFPSRKAVIA